MSTLEEVHGEKESIQKSISKTMQEHGKFKLSHSHEFIRPGVLKSGVVREGGKLNVQTICPSEGFQWHGTVT